MPLPDERPRASVANLIGKFETQNKRLSLSASSPSRGSSVVSHTTGDSTKEEAKERREWPPKSVESTMRQSHIVSSFSPRPTPTPLTTSTSSEKTDGSIALDLEVPLTAKALNASQMQAKADPEAFLENWRKDLPPETAMESTEEPPATAKPTIQEPAKTVTPTPPATKKLASPAPPRTLKSSTVKAAPAPKAAGTTSKPPVSSTPAKPAATNLKPPVRTATAAKPTLTAAPLKPQHTGQSVISTASTRRPVIKAPPPPKTPSRSESAARAKTPITASRPKTPSTGLFAPTAASLARSRNNAPPVPTPVKRATLSSSAMDRLSKPTAASQARMAAAAAVGPPPSSFRPTPASAARAAAASTAKPKPAAAAATPRKEPVKKDRVPSKQEAKPAETAGALVEPEAVAAASAVSLASSTTLSSTSETQENVPEDVVAEEESLPAPPEIFDETEGPVDHDVTPRSPSPPPRAEVIISLESEAEDVAGHESAEEHDDDPAVTTENGNGAATHKDDLEDIVNLLESTSIAKKVANDTTDNIPEEMSEIPDEEEK